MKYSYNNSNFKDIDKKLVLLNSNFPGIVYTYVSWMRVAYLYIKISKIINRINA